MRVLFIDDDQMLCSTLKEIFSGQEDVVVQRCVSEAEGLAAIKEVGPDVIFLDGDLTRLGAEGLAIAERMYQRLRIYTTTGREDLQESFWTRFEIKHVSKLDIRGLVAFVDKLRRGGGSQE